MASVLGFRKGLRLALAAGIAACVMAGTAAHAQPACASKSGLFPCSIGGTLLVVSPPTGNSLNGVGGSGGKGSPSFIEDPQNPGLTVTATTPVQFSGSAPPSLNGEFTFATVSGQPSINAARASITCGVTGATVYTLTLSAPGGTLVLNCPVFSAPGTVVVVDGQINFSPVTSLAMSLAISGSGNGVLTIEGFSLQIPDQNFVGSMPHLAAQENWTTIFTLVNKGAAPVQSQLSFFGDAVDSSGNGALMLPLAFPQTPPPSGPLVTPSYSGGLAANASLIVDTGGPQTPPVLVGSAQLSATGSVDGFAIFHQIPTAQEAVVPLETRYASSYLLPFDNTNALVLGVAVANISAEAANIPVVIRDDAGAVIGSPGASISLAAKGHTSFVLSDPTLGFPVTANKRGTIEFDTPPDGQISVLGLRFTPPNNALTTIPALANVGTSGGSIAHLASGGDGWQTTFVLVNTGTTAAPATLSFFADQTGLPQPLPLTFPQGNIPAMTAPSVTQTLAPGASLIIVSSGAPNLITGSAQLTTTGNVSGFVIFRHNGQEAVVPLESRNANGYIVAFDNTSGTATGIAVNAVSTGPVNVPVVVRDDTGAQIASDTVTLAPNGHYAFTLGTDRYPAALTIRGTIEFGTPAGAQIGALGIRIPNVAAHTYTTLPALTK
jgi:hypothetical protein